MANGPITQISDIIVPEIFGPYIQQSTEQKTRILQSGAAVRSADIDEKLAGGGLTFNVSSFRDLDDDDDRVSSDTPHAEFTGGSSEPDPKKIQTSQEIGVRLSRNQSWSSADLAAELAGADPMEAIGNKVSTYWARRLQAIFIATMNGVFADNDAAPSGSEHVQGDMTHDVKGASFQDGVTNFTAEAFVDAAVTMGDSMEGLGLVCVHSVVYARMIKNNLIDFIPDARGETDIATFLGREVIVDDGMPVSSGVYETWLFGGGSLVLGEAAAKVPVETERKAGSGNGGGSDVLYTRKVYALHPVGHKYAGSAPNGGPSNAATSNNLANAGSWERVYPERKQIKIARLITRES